MSSDFNAALARFSFYNRPVTNKYPSSEFTLLEAYNYIIGGISSLATEQCRSMTEEQRKDFKKTHFDCCTFSGVFKMRNSASLVRHSMLFCFDFDHLNDVDAVFGQLIDDRYFKADLVFYHRILKCHCIVELKAHRLDYADMAQLNMYIEYYRRHYMQPDDNPPVGLLLCTEYGQEMVEYVTPNIDPNVFVAQYELQLPSKEKIKEFLMKENKG